jgi:hypothetical protein
MEWALILAPLMIYLLVLGLWINRQRRPVVVGGPLDRLGLLLGLSGFLLLGPWSWLAHLCKPWGTPVYWLAYGLYVLALIGISAWFMLRARQTLVIYNRSPEVFEVLFQDVLDRMELRYHSTPGRIAFLDDQSGSTELMVDIETLPFLNNVSLHWQGEAEKLRGVLEDRLRAGLAKVEGAYNPAASILTLAGLVLLVFVFFTTAFYLAYLSWLN